MTFANQAPLDCWQEIQHDAGKIYVVVILGRHSPQYWQFAIRRRLDSLDNEHVRTELALARTELARVLRDVASKVEAMEFPL